MGVACVESLVRLRRVGRARRTPNFRADTIYRTELDATFILNDPDDCRKSVRAAGASRLHLAGAVEIRGDRRETEKVRPNPAKFTVEAADLRNAALYFKPA